MFNEAALRFVVEYVSKALNDQLPADQDAVETTLRISCEQLAAMDKLPVVAPCGCCEVLSFELGPFQVLPVMRPIKSTIH